jgi:hypothetical protein
MAILRVHVKFPLQVDHMPLSTQFFREVDHMPLSTQFFRGYGWIWPYRTIYEPCSASLQYIS